MDTFHHLVTAILVIVILYLLAIMMRRRGVLTEGHSLVLARIVTDLCQPGRAVDRMESTCPGIRYAVS